MQLKSFHYQKPRIIQQRSASRWLIWLLLIIIIVMISGWYAFDYGRLRSGFDSDSVDQQQQRLKKELAQLSSERDELKQQLAYYERSAQIDRDAARVLQTDISKLQQEAQDLKQKLAFYKGLTEGGEVTPTLRIHNFKISSTDKVGRYRVSLTVSQLLKNFGKTKGSLVLSLSGIKQGEEVTLPLEKLLKSKSSRVKLGFKSFQNVELLLELPDDFSPDAVTVKITPSSKKLKVLEQRFDWVLSA
ncbi:MAG: hypothetical protein KZQ58_04780 [gamma proteobacterium symbiont of Bathyaustriella thionipta]|nr:hypothetical protein [gamma proteobacterium symbiont of Bathyaustriella thionipta]